jgi:hypothetical protein
MPWPSKTNKCQLVKDIPLGTNFLKKTKNFLNEKKKHPSFLLQCYERSWFRKFDVIIPYFFTSENVKPQ